MAAKECRYGCKTMIEWDNEQSAFKETTTGFYHNKDRCNKIKENKPIVNQVTNSPAYKQEEQKQQQQTQQQQQQIDRPSLEAVLLTQISQSLEILKKKIEEQIELRLNETFELAKNNNLMIDALVAHHKLTEPKKASELWNQQQQQQQQQDYTLINHAKKADEYIASVQKQEEEREDKALEEQGI